jgi:hypothetical protein
MLEIAIMSKKIVKVEKQQTTYERSPRRRLASWMSLDWMVTRLAWMAQRLVSKKMMLVIDGR